ncbi:MAG: tautomerase family protein [Candidatus Altiarchaeota archaeon]|nr:tautomerase family protein [Candidatus Altiarchaeota archaeon]
MPVIRVSWWEGRTREQKERLAEAMTKDFCEVAGTPREHVWIVFEDVKKSDWAIGGELCDKSFPSAPKTGGK